MRLAVALFFLTCCLACNAPKPPQPHTADPAVQPYNRLLFTGDVMFSRAVRRQILTAHDPALPFRKIFPLLAAADITFVNLESPFSDRGAYFESGLIFHAPPDAVEGLQLAGVTLASTANNHSRDCGPHGVEYTVSWLRLHRISPLGSSESEAATHQGVVLVRHGVRFGFLGYTFDQQNGNWHDIDPRIALTDIPTLCRDVAALRKRSDVVIVSMHNGVEYQPKPNAAQVAFAHAAIDAGANFVIGHHPHVIQTEEQYHGGVIFYSLGNFVFDQFQRKETQRGEIVEISFLGHDVLSIHRMYVKITPTGPELETPPAEAPTVRNYFPASHNHPDSLDQALLSPSSER